MLRLLFFALIILIALLSCSSRKPDKSGAEASGNTPAALGAVSEAGGKESGVTDSGSSKIPSPRGPAASDNGIAFDFDDTGLEDADPNPEASGDTPAAISANPDRQSEAENPLLFADVPSPDSREAYETQDADLGLASSEITPPAVEFDPKEFNQPSEEPGATDSGSSEIPSPRGPAASDSDIALDFDDTGLEDTDPNPEASGDTPAAISANPDRQSEAENPLLFADMPSPDSREAYETQDADLGLASSEITPPAVEFDPREFNQPSEEPGIPPPSTAASTHLLEKSGELMITLDGIGWIFRSDRSTPGAWRFLGRDIVGGSSNFHFLFSGIGNWNLVFEQQNLSSGESEEIIRKVKVDEVDGLPSLVDNLDLAESSDTLSGTSSADADTRYTDALAASAAGKIDEAMKYFEQDASRGDSVGERARGAIVETAAKFGVVGPLLTWLPRYLEENPSIEVLRSALEVFTGEMGYDDQIREILEKLVELDEKNPEWNYRLAVILEKPGEKRDLDRSAQLYQEVINRWPLSEWRNLSEERLLWLQRHYFRVR